MKTYEETIESPRLEITYDTCSPSPREWSNIGIFLSKSLPDDRELDYLDRPHHIGKLDLDVVWKIITDLYETVSSTEEHAMKLKDELESMYGGDITVYPVQKYKHSGVNITLGDSESWDTAVTGFYIVDSRDVKESGVDNVEGLIASELEDYTQWCNGEVYQFILYSTQGEVEESCGGFYSLEDIKDELPSEWDNEDMDNYLIH